jgi:hypothetical protein
MSSVLPVLHYTLPLAWTVTVVAYDHSTLTISVCYCQVYNDLAVGLKTEE